MRLLTCRPADEVDARGGGLPVELLEGVFADAAGCAHWSGGGGRLVFLHAGWEVERVDTPKRATRPGWSFFRPAFEALTTSMDTIADG